MDAACLDPPRVLRSATMATLLVLAAACGERRQAAEGLGILLPASERAYWEPLAREFRAERPDVGLRIVEGPDSTDAREDLYTAALLSRAPTFDLVYLDVPWTAKFAAAASNKRPTSKHSCT